MPADATRLPEGAILNGSLAIARPVNTVIENAGTFYVSMNASVATYASVGGVGNVIAPAATGTAIPVTASGQMDITVGGGAETNTLAIPTYVGQQIGIVNGTNGGGTRTITASQAVNQAGNTKMAFAAAADACTLTAFSIAGALQWRVTYNDGVALS